MTPNKRVNPTVDPVTALAEDARAAPGSPAGYAQRSAFTPLFLKE